jgi:hypothetical protein
MTALRDRREAVLFHIAPELKTEITRLARQNGRSRVREIEHAFSNYVASLSPTPHEHTHTAANTQ